ncbi:AtpZ/AtpI family protein [Sphingosinicella rhizophila]|uniref:AtpZ/AtpI family protein n=1 Tax=Sphingosinicella rhizophila TaxID=3050082 RepID=A0ABU3QAV2_9SPHN|nr:AtpZ/AtpI family protein [Sphingosinicella sp. GR2756]MDT9600447.1 AtpZ/AtpI family protein [Sphingosinicella sp. GR2756]
MTENEPRQDPELSQDARLSSLDERLRDARLAEAKRTIIAKPDANYRQGMRVLGELLGAPFGGAVIGLVLDRWLGTEHWLLLVLLVFGFGIGIRNVIRISKTPPGSGPGAS